MYSETSSVKSNPLVWICVLAVLFFWIKFSEHSKKNDERALYLEYGLADMYEKVQDLWNRPPPQQKRGGAPPRTVGAPVEQQKVEHDPPTVDRTDKRASEMAAAPPRTTAPIVAGHRNVRQSDDFSSLDNLFGKK